jgi:hypothetical protein
MDANDIIFLGLGFACVVGRTAAEIIFKGLGLGMGTADILL